MDEIVNLILNSSISIVVIVFFMYRDLKFMTQLQTTLQALIDTVETLQDTIKNGGN